jgi:RNA polymerase sigma factor (sigma-70 family)
MPAGAPPASYSPAVEAALRAAWDAGRAEHEGLALPFARFAERVTALVARRSVAGESLEAAVARRAAADLVLACACEDGVAGAWDRLHDLLSPRLSALAFRLLRDRGEAETLAAEVLGDLATPAPGGAARTLVGTFDGTGTLFGWLAAILSRRAYGRARRSRGAPGGAAAAGDEPEGVEEAPARGGSSDPVEVALGSERAERFRSALSRAWESCTSNERFVLVAKYRGGVEQRAIARMLGVGPPRVTRLVQQVTRKLRDAVERAVGTAVLGGEDAWGPLLGVVQEHLATREAPPPPTPGGSRMGGMR